MPLSRHFYCLDEVQAALSYCCQKNQHLEALFWCEELLQSGCASEAISVLFESWIWNVGPFRLRWLLDNWHSLGSEEIQYNAISLSTYQLSSLHASNRDQSLFRILLSTHLDSSFPDRVTRKSPSLLPSDDPKECYFIRALYQGKARCAWWLALQLSMKRRWELLTWYSEHVLSSFQIEYQQCLTILQQYEKLLGYQTEAYDTVLSCLSIIMFCLSPEQQKDSFRPLLSTLDPNTQTSIESWQKYLGRKNRRLYTIPSGCLYGQTQRGYAKYSQHNRIQLHHVEKYIIGCAFWEEALISYASIDEVGNIVWNSEEDREAFYVRYFPDDIPDEWTKEEKDRSHGEGVLGEEESCTFYGFCSRFLSKPSRLYWSSFESFLQFLKTVPFDEPFPQCMVQPICIQIEDISLLRPVRKIKKIALS